MATTVTCVVELPCRQSIDLLTAIWLSGTPGFNGSTHNPTRIVLRVAALTALVRQQAKHEGEVASALQPAAAPGYCHCRLASRDLPVGRSAREPTLIPPSIRRPRAAALIGRAAMSLSSTNPVL